MKTNTTLWIPPHVYRELMFYAWKVDAEVGGYGKVIFTPEQNEVTVEELYLIKQEVSQVECTIKSDGTADLYQELIDAGKADEIGDIALWWHSHKDMGASFSSTDYELMNSWPGPYLVSLVVNRDGKMSATLTTKNPLLVISEISVFVDWFDVPEYEEWNKDIEKKVTKSPIKIYSPNKFPIYNKTDDNYSSDARIFDLTDLEWEALQKEEDILQDEEIESWIDSCKELSKIEKDELRKEFFTV